MSDSGGAIALQHASHADLIQRAAAVSPPAKAHARLDAIIVPASRKAKDLTTAIDLAKAIDCHLLVLCSWQTRPEEAQALFTAKKFGKGIAVTIPRSYEHGLLEFKTSEWAREGAGKVVCGGRDSDLSLKRNVGLLIARMLRWERVFFMDDDIRGITDDMLLGLVALLGRNGHGFGSAGLKVKYFPDNSVICHARRLVGKDQDVFVSGSVLAVDCTSPIAFFPDIYNEDWLFFYRDVAAGRLASPGLLATQLKYEPFADVQRAIWQEFGDVIAEGLYALLHEKQDSMSGTLDFWSRFLLDRRAVHDDITRNLEHAPKESRDDIGKAVDAARRKLDDITPEMCVSYLTVWGEDLQRWESVRDELPIASSVEEALRLLGLRSPLLPPGVPT